MKVMIIDDHPGIRSLLRQLLAECVTALPGCSPQFVECDSDEMALAALTVFAPDLITLDLRINGMDARYCIRRMRERLPDALIIVVTGLAGESVSRHSYLAGANGLICKDDLTAIQPLVRDRLAARESA